MTVEARFVVIRNGVEVELTFQKDSLAKHNTSQLPFFQSLPKFYYHLEPYSLVQQQLLVNNHKQHSELFQRGYLPRE